jgi:hypothetical protein
MNEFLASRALMNNDFSPVDMVEAVQDSASDREGIGT